MKINEKNLCYFATSPPIDLEGWLQKRGEMNKSWQRRYFILKGNLLFYFEKRGDREPLGVIILEGCTIELAEEGEQYCFQIVFHGINNRTYVLSAESQEIMERWMKALTCAGYEYMKLIVAELQRQLNEIEGSRKNNNKAIESPPKPPPRRQNPFNRTAPPPPATPNEKVYDGGSGGNGASQSYSISSSYSSNATDSSNQIEFNFQIVHETFGREIMKDLDDRKRIKELSQRPLIEL